MGKYTIISAKITEEERREIKNLGLNPTVIIRKAVQEEIRKSKKKDLIEKMKSVQPILRKLNINDVVTDIREDRER